VSDGEIGLFDAMYTQKAIRRLKPDPVPDELITKLLEAATKAPSGGDRQPWSFIVIRNQETKDKLAGWYRDAWDSTYGRLSQEQRTANEAFARMYRSAEHLAFHMAETPVLIMVCAQSMPPGLGGAAASSHYGSVYPAVQNLLLAARGLGLGASLTTLHKLHDDEVKELLGVPANAETVALIPIGYPRGKYGPAARKPLEEVVHYEHWKTTPGTLPKLPNV
jgi:nitroreductase